MKKLLAALAVLALSLWGAGGAHAQDSSSNVGPYAGKAYIVVTGGTAITLAAGPIHGGYVTNPLNAASQCIAAAENAYVDPVASPGSTDAAANSTTVLLQAGQNYTIPPLANGIKLRANAATSGHCLTVVLW